MAVSLLSRNLFERVSVQLQRDVLKDYMALAEGYMPRCLSEARTMADRLRRYLPSALKRAGGEIDPEALEAVCTMLEDGSYLLYGYDYEDLLEDAIALPEGA